MYVNPGQIDPGLRSIPNPIPAGGEAIGEFEPFDAFDFFVMLGAATCTRRLRAADLVVGGGSQTYRQDDEGVRAGDGGAEEEALLRSTSLSALQAWAAGMPGATVDDPRRLQRIHVV